MASNILFRHYSMITFQEVLDIIILMLNVFFKIVDSLLFWLRSTECIHLP